MSLLLCRVSTVLAFEQRLLAVVHSSGTYNAAVRIVQVFTLKSEKVVQFDHKKMKTTENYISCGTTLYINQVWICCAYSSASPARAEMYSMAAFLHSV